MPPASQSTLYTAPNDVAALLGLTGLQLRLDDDGSSSLTAAGASNADPMVITSAAHGLQTGDMVRINGVVGAVLANGVWFITRIDANTFSIPVDGTSTGTYVSGGTITAYTQPESGYLLSATNVATAKINRFCQPLYDTADLATSWSVWHWATVMAAHWICARRGNPIPGSLLNLYLESLDELHAVRTQQMAIEDIGLRNSAMPVWSNVRMDRRWSIKQLRVETVLSDRTNPNFPQKQDAAAQILGPVEQNSF